MKLSVSDLSARLTALGYPGDALQVAMIAARNGGGTSVTRENLHGLILGKRAGSPTKSLARSATTGQLEKKQPSTLNQWKPQKAWKDSVDNISGNNDQKPSC